MIAFIIGTIVGATLGSQPQPSSPQGLTKKDIKTQGGANYGKVRIYRNLGGNQRANVLRVGRRVAMSQPFEYESPFYNEVIDYLETKWQRKLTEHERAVVIEGYRFGRLVEASNEIRYWRRSKCETN
jgi:hypothetical protein